MADSLLYQLHSAGLVDDVAMPTHFEEAYTSTNQMVRIWKVTSTLVLTLSLLFVSLFSVVSVYLSCLHANSMGWLTYFPRSVLCPQVVNPSKESKEFCKFYHRYPPALNEVLAKRKDFQQIHGLFSSE